MSGAKRVIQSSTLREKGNGDKGGEKQQQRDPDKH